MEVEVEVEIEIGARLCREGMRGEVLRLRLRARLGLGGVEPIEQVVRVDALKRSLWVCL